MQIAPEHGSIDCVDNTLGTVCNYECDEGYELLGPESIECVRDYGIFGQWSQPPPICKGIVVYSLCLLFRYNSK